ncbi:hypothetical protein ACJX0J_008914, partial [Zea mays]
STIKQRGNIFKWKPYIIAIDSQLTEKKSRKHALISGNIYHYGVQVEFAIVTYKAAIYEINKINLLGFLFLT